MNIKNLINLNFLRKIILVAGIISVGAFAAYSQNVTVTGSVSDATGAIQGANVTVKGATIGVLTDAEGKYSISLPSGDATLVFSLLGYETKEIPVGGRTVVNAVLEESSEMIEEVVVVGYGVQKKLTATGAVTAINSKDIITTKNNNVQNSLTGKIAGVKVVQGTSEPGNFGDGDTKSAMEFSIRGLGTPLIVIDGVPRDNMVRLDSNEIESISVLKDGSAAVYGARAANGVVLITTKKGKRGEKFRFDYTGYVGGQTFLYTPEMMDALQVMELRNEQRINNFANAGQGYMYQPSQFEPYLNGTKQSTDWWSPYIKEFPLQTQHSLSATGGGDVVDYFFNFGYYNQQGMWKVKSSKYDRFNLRSNVNARLAKGLKAEVLINLMQDHRVRQPEGTWRIYRAILEMNPLLPYFADNDPAYPIQGSPDYRLDMEKDGYWKFNESLVQTNVALDWEIPWVEGLKARGMYSLDYKVDETKNYRKGFDNYNEQKQVAGGSTWRRMDKYYDRYQNSLLQLSLNYEKKIKEHNISVMMLYEESDREADNIRYDTGDLLIDVIDQPAAGDPSRFTLSKNDASLYHYANKGLVGRFNYDYASKYLFDFSFRYDGSSRFAPEHQWGFFPSISAGWRLSEEKFIKNNISFLNNLKIRGSYGVLGDDGEAAYQFYQGYTYPSRDAWEYPGYWEFGGKKITALQPLGLTNKNLTWIEAATIDLGLDVELWNGLLGATIDLFRRDRTGLLATRSGALPSEVGATMPQENLNGDITLGYEITLTHKNKIQDFSYNVSANMSFNRTKATHVERAPSVNSYRNWRDNMNDRWKVYGADNNPASNMYFGVDYMGQYTNFNDIYNGPIYDSRGNSSMLPGDLIYDDWNGDGVIDDLDVHPIQIQTGQRPLITYGISIGAEYKGFDLNMVFNGVAISNIRQDGDRRYYESAFAWGSNNAFTMFMDRWHRADPWNPSPYQEWVPGFYPSQYTENNRNYITQYNSNFWVANGSYIRLKSLELGYTLPKTLVQKIKFTNARVFVNAYNLFTISKFRIADPERTKENNSFNYPVAQTYSIGLNLSF